jgi:glycosyltransferase involved in cell wall biosynthesis
MKIGMMGGWNTDSGASFLAELIGRPWVEEGHELTVFTFYNYAFHGTQIIGVDEEYVTRCFTVSGYTPNTLNPVPFLTTDYDIFVVQDLGMLPKDLLGKIYQRIKKKAKTVNVIHDGKLAEDPAFYQFDWDAVVCFDDRYKSFLAKAYDPDKIHIIPYPCYPSAKGDKVEARKKLGLPRDKKIVFGFGPAAKTTVDVVNSIAELSRDYPLLLLVVTKDKTGIQEFGKLQKQGIMEIELREEAPEIKRLFDYLHASDALIFNKESASNVVVSSTVLQCLSSGCPIVARDSNYVEYLDKEVMKYSSEEELKKKLCSIFEESKEYKTTMRWQKNM